MFRLVRLTAAPDIAEWLGTRPRMEWDAGNSTKSQTKHGFSIADVESILDAGEGGLRCSDVRRTPGVGP
jgi:hypothetical protein